MTSESVKIGPRAAAKAVYCRQQACQVRQLADRKGHLRGLLLGIAEQYEEAAEDLELGAAMVRHAILLPPC